MEEPAHGTEREIKLGEVIVSWGSACGHICCSFLKDMSLATAVAPSFVPSLGIDLSALHAANNLKYISIRGSCLRCLPNSQVSSVARCSTMQQLH